MDSISRVAGKQVAFLGLGIMGSSMAANLAKAGACVKGWNRTPNNPGSELAANAGVLVVSTLKEAVATAQVVFSCVGDERDAEALLGQQLAGCAAPNSLVVDFTTIGPACAKRIEQSLSKNNIRFLDAPVTGGDVGARQATLTILVGGSGGDFEEAKPLLETMGKKIVHCGPSGSGQAMKLCNQILCALNMVAVCEALTLADEMNIAPELLLQSLSEGAGGSWALANLGPRIAKGDYSPGFTLTHMLKDLRLVQENSGETGLLQGTKLATRLFEKAQSLGGGRQGTQSMYRVYAESGDRVGG